MRRDTALPDLSKYDNIKRSNKRVGIATDSRKSFEERRRTG